MTPTSAIKRVSLAAVRMAAKTERRRRALGMPKRLLFATAVLLSYAPYHFLNQRGAISSVLQWSIEGAIPFVPVFVVPYFAFYPFVLLTIVHSVFFSRATLKTACALVFCYNVASLMYLFFQTTVPRPALEVHDTFSAMVALLYRYDHPYNCFPSLHVAISVCAYSHWKTALPRYDMIFLGLASLIVVSTLLIKQHCLDDVFGGICLAVTGVWIGNKCDEKLGDRVAELGQRVRESIRPKPRTGAQFPSQRPGEG